MMPTCSASTSQPGLAIVKMSPKSVSAVQVKAIKMVWFSRTRGRRSPSIDHLWGLFWMLRRSGTPN